MIRTQHLIVTGIDERESLLVNTLTGALLRIPNRLRPLLEGPERRIDPATLDESERAVIDRLAKLGCFFPSEEEEAAAFDRLWQKIADYRRNKPSQHSLAVTHSCFFRCPYCFEAETITAKTTLRPEDVPAFLAGLDVLERIVEATRPPTVALYGGEPLQPKTRATIERLLELGAERGIRFSAVTNGYFLDRFLDLFGRFRKTVYGLQVVIDGPQHIHDKRRILAGGGGTFDRIVANIDRALDAGLEVRMRLNIDRENLPWLPELADFIQARGWTAYRNFRALTAPVEDHLCQGIPELFSEDELIAEYLRLCQGEATRDAMEIYDGEKVFAALGYVESRVRPAGKLVLPKLAYCDANTGKGFCFGADGLIYPCYKALEDRQAAVGRFLPSCEIDEASLAAWLGRTLRSLPECRACPAGTLCGGGCAYSQLKRGLSMQAPNCPPVRESFDRYVQLRKGAIRQNVRACSSCPG